MPDPVTIDPADLTDVGRELLNGPNVGHVSFTDSQGRIVTSILWVHGRDGKILTSSPVGSAKGRWLRERPQVAVSVVHPTNQFRYISVSGEVTKITPDDGLAFIDEMSRKYLGSDYGQREWDREVFEITPTKVRASTGTW